MFKLLLLAILNSNKETHARCRLSATYLLCTLRPIGERRSEARSDQKYSSKCFTKNDCILSKLKNNFLIAILFEECPIRNENFQMKSFQVGVLASTEGKPSS